MTRSNATAQDDSLFGLAAATIWEIAKQAIRAANDCSRRIRDDRLGPRAPPTSCSAALATIRLETYAIGTGTFYARPGTTLSNITGATAPSRSMAGPATTVFGAKAETLPMSFMAAPAMTSSPRAMARPRRSLAVHGRDHLSGSAFIAGARATTPSAAPTWLAPSTVGRGR